VKMFVSWHVDAAVCPRRFCWVHSSRN